MRAHLHAHSHHDHGHHHGHDHDHEGATGDDEGSSTGFLPMGLAVGLFVTGLFVLGLIPGVTCGQ
ncbi:hypothetical protein [Paraliomyxa miuraensis]|uniref:hypothetical protein n=1 Tax=Paraliomyxa miuraensis TaxID=376150 RepID=UPI0022593484|nr:hypothetical protein [Paraliomyxa miuraensis]MCX4243723.1 hypothetical protein [Paraliomyxa miuraensis]